MKAAGEGNNVKIWTWRREGTMDWRIQSTSTVQCVMDSPWMVCHQSTVHQGTQIRLAGFYFVNVLLVYHVVYIKVHFAI